ncbi:MAG: NYN domain-containing protein [Anaerolineae bacterium]|nr:NYN domain-containing protein [Anaerolineae bacterium]
MPFLIDGHNLIAALPDIHIEDPEDEVALIIKLRGWLGHKRRKATVVFDGGIPGGYSRQLSSMDLEVIFAAHKRSTADRIIMKHLGKLRDPGNWTVVSSDREILDFARRVGARVLTSQEFALDLQPAARLPMEKPREPSPAEVHEWLEVFPEPPEPAERPPTAPPKRPPASPLSSAAGEAPTPLNPPPGKRLPTPSTYAPTLAERAVSTQLAALLAPEPSLPAITEMGKPEEASAEEVADWLQVFHDVPEGPHPPRRLLKAQARPERPASLAVDKETEAGLPPEDVEAWLELFPEPQFEVSEVDETGKAATPKVIRRRHSEAFRSPKLRKHQARTPELPDESVPDDSLSPEEREQWFRLYGEASED